MSPKKELQWSPWVARACDPGFAGVLRFPQARPPETQACLQTALSPDTRSFLSLRPVVQSHFPFRGFFEKRILAGSSVPIP